MFHAINKKKRSEQHKTDLMAPRKSWKTWKRQKVSRLMNDSEKDEMLQH